ncbi:MAG: hypothetical protein LUQ39_00585 [Methanomassiliicoccales archaeon]|nr:hypothetical protein [Methanomassiliicoccales archaeon]
MTRLVDKGVLVRAIESTDPMAQRKRMVLLTEWVSLPIIAVVFLGLLLYMDMEGNDYFYVVLAVLMGILLMEAFTVLFIANHFHAYTEPIKIYSEGVEAYSSTLNKLRGVDGFLQKSDLLGIELRDVSVNGQGQRDYDRSITLQLSNGKHRLIGIRNREAAMDAAKTMSLMWELIIEDFPAKQRRR